MQLLKVEDLPRVQDVQGVEGPLDRPHQLHLGLATCAGARESTKGAFAVGTLPVFCTCYNHSYYNKLRVRGCDVSVITVLSHFLVTLTTSTAITITAIASLAITVSTAITTTPLRAKETYSRLT